MSFVRRVLLCLVIALMAPAVVQAAYPDRTIRIIVPFAPGGGTDLLARVIAQKLTDLLGQQVIVENRPGASGTTGTLSVARAEPDGYTLLIVNALVHTATKNLITNIAYDPVKSFRPIGFIGISQYILTINPNFPAKTLDEFLKAVRAEPGKYNFASAGHGSSPHLATELFLREAGLKMVHVPYQGSGPAMVDTVAGVVQMDFDNIVGPGPLVESGKLRALGVTGTTRSPKFPNIPTLAELGLNVDVVANFGLVAPAATPDAIIAQLNSALVKILREPDTQQRLMNDSLAPRTSTPEEFGAVLSSEERKWERVIRDADIKMP